MFERRLEITLPLEVLSPLHIGTGDVFEDNIKDPRAPGANTPEGGTEVTVAAVQRQGLNGPPILPGSTVKGMIRRILPPDWVASLCGWTSELGGESDGGDTKKEDARTHRIENRTGSQGRLTVYAAVGALSGLESLEALPHGNRKPGTYIHARTRIDGTKGTAYHNHLFHAEAVAPGVRFSVRLHLDLSGGGEDPEGFQANALDALAIALGALAAEDGVPCGRGKSQGNGRLRLIVDDMEAKLRCLSEDGILGRKTWSEQLRRRIGEAAPLATTEEVANFLLECEGPYLTVDYSKHGQQKDDTESGKETTPQILPFQADWTTPMVAGSAVMGALRARAQWLLALSRLSSLPPYDDDPNRLFEPHKGHTPNDLSPVQRLFGVTGWKGTLGIAELKVVSTGHGSWVQTSVALDQFSGAPIDGALYTTRSHVGVRIRLRLTLDIRAKLSESLVEEDRTLINDLIEGIRANGLMLGHGVNKGYGWFTEIAARPSRDGSAP